MRRRKRLGRDRCSGFTAVEMMISIVIFVVLTWVVFNYLRSGKATWQVGDIRVNLHQQLRQAMDVMVQDLRQSAPVTITDVPADNNEYTSISFRIPDTIVDGHIVWDTDVIHYQLAGVNGMQLIRAEGGTQRALANDISSFIVKRQSTSPQIVEIELIAEKEPLLTEPIEVSLDFQVKLRN